MPPTSASAIAGDYSRKTARRFLDMLWGDELPPRSRLLLWKNGDCKLSHWCYTLDAAADLAAGESDWYIGCGLRPTNVDFGARQRGESKHVCAIPGLWADIDIADPVHAKAQLPESAEAAQRLVESFPLAPTVVVGSGHGLQLWWLFREPWIWGDDHRERERARLLAAGWHRTLLGCARRMNYVIDNVSDLARVMRLPGTRNAKRPDAIVDVVILRDDGPRHNPDDLDRWMADRPANGGEETAVSGGGGGGGASATANANGSGDWQVSAEAMQSAATKIDLAIENDSKFRSTWRHQRRDIEDTSPSGWEMAICCFFARAEFTRDEMAAGIKLHRQRWYPSATEKANRRDYLDRTISKALEIVRGPHLSDAAANRILSFESHLQRLGGDGGEADGNIVALREIFGGLPIQRVVRQGKADSIYTLYLIDEQTISLGKNLFDQHAIRIKVANWSKQCLGTTVILRVFKPEVWGQSVVTRLINASEQENAGDGEPSEMMRSYLQLYLDSVSVGDQEQVREMVPKNLPFRKDGLVYVHLTRFSEWLAKRKAPLARNEMHDRMNIIGFRYMRVSVRHGGKSFCRGYWRGRLGDTGKSDGEPCEHVQ